MGLHIQNPWTVVLAVLLFSETISSASSCKPLPGDFAWPSKRDWTQLNDTVQGRLIQTIPIASVCHTAGIAAYNKAACKNLSAAVSWPDGEPY